MKPEEFYKELEKNGHEIFICVPCSILTKLVNYIINNGEYISAVREDEAMGIAAGAYMAGKKPVVMMQNSGLGNSINPLASLNLIYNIPVLMIITWRGFEGRDAPEHLVMGRSMLNFLKELEIPHEIITEENYKEVIVKMNREMEERKRPAALILKKGVIE